jgi:hypothetical protein
MSEWGWGDKIPHVPYNTVVRGLFKCNGELPNNPISMCLLRVKFPLSVTSKNANIYRFVTVGVFWHQCIAITASIIHILIKFTRKSLKTVNIIMSFFGSTVAKYNDIPN